MNRKLLWLLLTAILLVLPHRAEAQQSTKITRVGFLSSLTPNVVSDHIDAFRHGLSELGYVERKNILIEYRYAEEDMERVPALATELVRLKVDVILTGGPSVNRFATHRSGIRQ